MDRDDQGRSLTEQRNLALAPFDPKDYRDGGWEGRWYGLTQANARMLSGDEAREMNRVWGYDKMVVAVLYGPGSRLSESTGGGFRLFDGLRKSRSSEALHSGLVGECLKPIWGGDSEQMSRQVISWETGLRCIVMLGRTDDTGRKKVGLCITGARLLKEKVADDPEMARRLREYLEEVGIDEVILLAREFEVAGRVRPDSEVRGVLMDDKHDAMMTSLLKGEWGQQGESGGEAGRVLRGRGDLFRGPDG